MSIRRSGVLGQSRSQWFDRLICLAHLDEGCPEIEQGLGMSRGGIEDLLKLRGRRRELVQAVEHHPEVDPGVNELGVGLERRLVFPLGLRVLATRVVDLSDVVMGSGVRGLALEDLVVARRLAAQEPVAILKEEPRLGADAAQPRDGGELSRSYWAGFRSSKCQIRSEERERP